MSFPSSFLFGTATSATQIEGGCKTSDWYEFARRIGTIKNGDTPDVACGSWARWQEDVELQHSLGMGAYRMSIEWARIEPGPGEINRAVLHRYRRMLSGLRDAGIEPMVTLHHFTLPNWLAARGGVSCPDFPERLAVFARIAVCALGDLCKLWITINEPSVLISQGYLRGIWPPERRSPVAALRAHHNLVRAHDAAYRAMKKVHGDEIKIGVAHHLRPTSPARPDSHADQAAAFLRGFAGDVFAIIACRHKTQDFFGINYYSRDVVRFPMTRIGSNGAPASDLGWEIYPEGLGQLVRKWAPISKLPIYITENGIADAADSRRADFLTGHLAQLASAIADGIDVRGYFHWSLLDNFEWAEGYEPRFGLVAVDYATGERTPRPSAKVYSRIARERVLPSAP
jgi:beta-glucosidase